MTPNLLVLHPERLFQFSVDVVQAEGLGSGVLAAGGAAHLLVALSGGEVAGVGGLLTAIAGVRALRVKGPVGDLVG